MKNEIPRRITELAKAAASILEGGLRLGEDTRHYMDSVLGCDDPEQLPRLMGDASHPEHQSLLELIYFPDFEARLELEPVLREHSYQEKDSLEATEIVVQEAPITRISVNSSSLELPTSPRGAFLFLSRLHPEREPDPEVAAELENCLDFPDVLRFRIHLRAFREILSPPAKELLRDVIRTFYSDADLENGFLHLLSLAPRIRENTDIVSALASRRFRLESALDRSRQQKKELHSHAVETLLTRGASVLSIDEDAVIAEMRWIDSILIHVYQVMPQTGIGPELHMDSGERNGQQWLFDFFRRLDY